VRLYDIRKIDGGAFAAKTFELKDNNDIDKDFLEFNSIKFGPQGKYIIFLKLGNI
jgi:hypothetical protein